MQQSTNVFNQYYFELLKKIRDKARGRKYDSREARHILKGVKANYQSYDKSADEHRAWFEALWTSPDNGEPITEPTYLYKDVKLSDVKAIFDSGVLDHFIGILKLFMKTDVSADDVGHAVKALRTMSSKEAFDNEAKAVQNERVRAGLEEIYKKHADRKGGEMDDAMKRIEGTSLGKLAKEIMDEINVEEIQQTVTDGDILKSLSNPDGPLTKVLSTVSAKMISKMASGELQQESLLEDAMKLAGDLGMGGGAGKGGGLGGLGDMGEMIKQMQRMGMGMMGGKGGGMGGMGSKGGKRPHARQVRRKMKPKKPEATTTSEA